MNRIFALSAAVAATLGLAACEPTGTTAGAPGAVPTGDFVLVGIGADAVPTRDVLLTIAPDGSISGRGPCNSYTGKQNAVPPAFQVGPLGSTRMACPAHKGLEGRYFQALESATGINYEGGVLKITGPTYLTFEPGRPASMVEAGAAAVNTTAAAVDAASR
ncbi:META domain-containing protein [Paracoccus sp. (in: a-proteobacteria)]|uniref:META domain-containing protein n=1 Tax=Paracoccus sp. TaxID=267 RepID=UPI00289C0CEA|nr:META domain-containing protein [Paracoccus sp. (in: a-proteobacteria)]